MPVEIERKFLVAKGTWKGNAESEVHILQGYIISENHCSVRVRLIDQRRGTLTTKLPCGGISRFEFEQEISRREANALLEMCNGRIVEKKRYKISVEDHVWDIDVYQGANAGLVVAEIELNWEEQNFVLPDWVGMEITGVDRFLNSRLSSCPFINWQDEYQAPIRGAY